jgi:GDPmannose 4,6-dehydratase
MSQDRTAQAWETDLAGARALVTGLTGQDGYYLAHWLRARGAAVAGCVHPAEMEQAQKLAPELGHPALEPADLEQAGAIDDLIARVRPDIVYHLAAQSSVGRSWQDPLGTARTNAMGTLHLLEALRHHAPRAAFVMAGSCDCYDHDAAGPVGVTPDTPFKTTNPYAATKVMAHQMAQCYRDHYGTRASVAILFNHTSPRRSEIFVERGVVRNAVRVSLGLLDKVPVGSLLTRRDWSWAEEIVEGFGLMGAMAEPADLVLASGLSRTVGDWVREAFAQLGLDLERHMAIDASRLHPGDRPHTFGNIELTRRVLGWEPRVDLAGMVRRMIEVDRAELTAGK